MGNARGRARAVTRVLIVRARGHAERDGQPAHLGLLLDESCPPLPERALAGGLHPRLREDALRHARALGAQLLLAP